MAYFKTTTMPSIQQPENEHSIFSAVVYCIENVHFLFDKEHLYTVWGFIKV